MRTAIGVDLGGSHVTAAVITEDGKIHSQHERDLSALAFQSVVDALTDTIGQALKEAGKDASAIGIGSPGNIEAKTGTVVYSPNFGWKDAPLGEALRANFKLPLFVGNDARCATLGEHTFGSGRATKDFALLTLGTGIGGGIISDGAWCSATVSAQASSAIIKFARPMALSADAARSAVSRRKRRERA